MPIRDSLARWLGVETKASIVGLTADELPDRALEKQIDDATLLSTFGDDAWPYILANKIGEQSSQAPIQVGRVTRAKNGSEDFEPVGPQHPVQHLFDDPNPLMDGGEFIHLLMLYMELVGHAPIEIVKPTPGAIIGAPGRAGQRRKLGFELWQHAPSQWRIVANPDATIKGYLWLNTSETDVRWEPDQMTYLRWPNPTNRWYGQGRLQATRQQVMAEEYAAIRDKKFEKNLGVPPGILSSEMPLGDPQAAELQKRWEKAVGGYQNAGKIAVLGGKTTYQAIAQSSRDAEWLAQRLNRVEIMAGAFGVPLPLIRMQDATFSNANAARAEFWEGTLQPRLNRIARMLTVRLLPLITSEPLEVRFDYTQIEALGENDLEAAQTAAQWAATGVVTVDELRARLGQDAHDDPLFGARIVTPSTISYKLPEEVAQTAALGVQGAQAALDATLNPPPQQPPDAPPPGGKARKAVTVSRDTLLDPIRDGYKRDLSGYFAAQHAALTPLTGKALPSDEGQAIIDRAIEILTAKRWRERLSRFSEPVLRSSITLGAAGAADTLGVGVSFSIPASEAALQLLTAHLERLAVGIQNTTVDDVRRVLTDSLRSHATAAETRAALSELFDGYEQWRLERISRTETTAAYNLGSIGQYRDAGVIFVTVVDGDQDAVCADWNGRTHVPLDEAENSPLGHPNAVMAGTSIEVLGGIEVGYRANWNGPLVSLATAGNAHLAIGPNHPVLTSRGWIAAKAIRKGDKVIRRTFGDAVAAREHLYQPVAGVEHIFDALSASGTHGRVVAAPTYFHGDGNFCEGEVEIVRPERPLLVDAVTPGPQLVGEPLLVGAGAKSALLSGDGSRVTHGETVLLAPAGGMSRSDARRVVGGLATLDATLDEPLSDGAIADAEFVADFVRRTAIAVALDEVIDIGRAEFAGHAFDLQTTSGAYFADSILVHNCTRTWIPETGDLGGRTPDVGFLSAEPEMTKTVVPNISITFADGSLQYHGGETTILPPAVTVDAPVTVNVPAQDRPVVNVAATDLAPVTAAVTRLRQDMADVRAEIRKPRKRTLTHDELGRVTGSQDAQE